MLQLWYYVVYVGGSLKEFRQKTDFCDFFLCILQISDDFVTFSILQMFCFFMVLQKKKKHAFLVASSQKQWTLAGAEHQAYMEEPEVGFTTGPADSEVIFESVSKIFNVHF